MNFQTLLDGAEILEQSGNPPVSGIEYDSRQVKPGDTFVAMLGESSDGNKFIDKAIAASGLTQSEWARKSLLYVASNAIIIK